MADKDKNNIEDDELIEDEEIDEDDEVIYDEEDDEEYDDDEAGSGGGRGFDLKSLGKQNLFFIIGIAAMVIFVIVYMFMRPNPAKNKEANVQMAQAIRYFENNADTLALNGDGQNPGFLTISKKYSGTPAGNTANYYLSVIYYRQKDVAKGLKYAEKFKTGDNLASAMAHYLRGYGHEEQGAFGKAASAYETAAKTPAENEFTSPFFYLAAARSYESAGKNSKAADIYKTLKEKYPETEEGQKAAKFIGKVSN